MSTSSWTTTASMAAQRAPTERDSYDTALPPILSRDMAVGRRRPAFRPDSTMVIGNFRGMQQFHSTHDMIARGQGLHRRTESTLKTVMRKIFHRKRRIQANDLEEGDPVLEPYDLSGLTKARQSEDTRNQETFVPLPKHHHAQKEHSPLQKDFRPTLRDLNKLDPIPIHQRRATLPSLVFSDDADRDKSGGPLKSPDMGQKQALHVHRIQHNRCRSRSTNSLRRKANEHRMSPIQCKRRSAEITYPGSPAFGAVSDSELSCRPPTRATVASMTKPDAQSIEESEAGPEQHPQAADVEPSVGNLVHTMQHDENLTVEQRVTTLEVKLIDLEFAIARLQDEPRSDSSPTDKSRSKKSATPDTARTPKPPHSGPTSLFSPAMMTPALTTPGLPPVTSHQNFPRFPFSESRPASTSTIRANSLHRSHAHQPTSPSPPLVNCESAISAEQYSTLVHLLRREQSARRNLESQMSSLREDMQQLQKTARSSMSMSVNTSTGASSPISSTDSQAHSHDTAAVAAAPAAAYRLPPITGLQSSSQSHYPPTNATPPPEKFFAPSSDGSMTDLGRSSELTPRNTCDMYLRKLEQRVEVAGMI